MMTKLFIEYILIIGELCRNTDTYMNRNPHICELSQKIFRDMPLKWYIHIDLIYPAMHDLLQNFICICIYTKLQIRIFCIIAFCLILSCI